MKRLKLLSVGIVAALSAVTALTSCSPSAEKEKKETHKEWTESLNDSIAGIKRDIDSCQNNIDILHDQIASLLNGFKTVERSREVEGYIIRNGWQNRYPLQSTGIIARISMSEGFELVAAHTGAPFSKIEAVCGSESIASENVPNDQGLNYRRGNLTTVLFTGEKADSIGEFISRNCLNNMSILFIGNGNAGRYSISHGEMEMISETWQLYSKQKNVEMLEARIPLLNQKINILRKTIDRNNNNNNK